MRALDLDALDALVPVAVRMLDNAIDASRFPLDAQAAEALAKRRIGLGSHRASRRADHVRARYTAVAARGALPTTLDAAPDSRGLSRLEPRWPPRKAPFRYTIPSPILAGETVAGLDAEDVREAIRKYGIRNALLTSWRRPGTISLFADNVSSGLEPVFSLPTRRNVLMPDGAQAARRGVSDYAYPPVPPDQGRNRAAARCQFRRRPGQLRRPITW